MHDCCHYSCFLYPLMFCWKPRIKEVQSFSSLLDHPVYLLPKGGCRSNPPKHCSHSLWCAMAVMSFSKRINRLLLIFRFYFQLKRSSCGNIKRALCFNLGYFLDTWELDNWISGFHMVSICFILFCAVPPNPAQSNSHSMNCLLHWTQASSTLHVWVQGSLCQPSCACVYTQIALPPL